MDFNIYFRDRYKVRRIPSQHWTYFKSRREAIKFITNGYYLTKGDWELYKLDKHGYTTKVNWF